MKKSGLIILLLFVCVVFVIIWMKPSKQELTSVGFLFPDSMYDQTWGTEGYKGMLEIVQKYDAAFFYEEHINTKEKIRKAVNEMSDRNVSLLYGQGIEYTRVFNELSADYPEIHFVVFNGHSKADNVTAVNIDGYSMGYFGGMLAAHTSETNQLGIIGSFKTQPEIKGFIAGAQFENHDIKIIAHYLETFSYDPRGIELAQQLKHEGADVIFPAADGVNAEIMNYLADHDINTIGYIADQSKYGANVLSSVQLQLSHAYEQMADDFVAGRLRGGTRYLGINEQMVALGPLSYKVDDDYRRRITSYLNHYKETHELPSGQRPPKAHDELYQRSVN